VRLVNVIPNAQSGETGRDSEPSIAVNPRNPQQIAISSFTNDPGGSANIPLFLSTDGGVNWTLSVPIVPGVANSKCVASVCDITVRFATTSNFLYAAALEGDSVTDVTTYRITRVTNTFGAPAADTLRTRTGTGTNIPDQPYVEANTVLGGGGTGSDRLIVPFNDLTVFPGQTATVDRTLNAVPPAPGGFAGFVVEARVTPSQDSPPVRSAVHASGVVYAAFTGRRAGGNEIVVTRDDNWGTGPGAFQAITDGDEAIHTTHGFLVYPIATLGSGAKPVVAAEKNYTADADAILARLSERTKIVFLANPNNPTGTSLGEADFAKLVRELPPHVVLAADEAYYEFVRRPDFPDSVRLLRERRTLIVLRTFSKAYALAGLRIGYAIADKELIGYLERARHPFIVNSLAQVAAAAALADRAHTARIRDLTHAGIAQIEAGLKKLGLRYAATDANFLLVEVGANADQLQEKLLRHGVITRPLGGFGLATHLRVSIGTAEENERFLTSLAHELGR
jgi:histidinol-phosphate aminotransferase